LVAVVATFTLAVAALVTGLSGPAHAGPPPAAANAAIQGQHLNGDENGEDCTDDPPAPDQTNMNNDNKNDNHDCDHKTTPPPTTVTTTITTTTTTTATSPTMTALPVTGSSSGGGVLALVGAGLLMAGGVGMFGLRRLRDRRG
jgi:LPXTG-motif cell wall-anchored protein